MPKVDRLLATLRGETPPPESEAVPAAETAAAAPSEDLEALKARLAELEGRLAQAAAAPPPLEPPPPEVLPEEVPPAAPPEPASPPPAPPTELVLFLQTRMELIEKRLELAQQEALRAGLMLREREEAQRKAQGEVEELFRGIREAQRAAGFEKKLREDHARAAARIRELEGRLTLAQLRMIPAEEVLRAVESEEGRAELRRRLEEQLKGSEKPLPPPPELLKAPLPAPSGPSLDTLSVVLGRVADLERRLEEAHKERDKERAERKGWEENILAALTQSRRRWEKGGGPELVVEAALEAVVESVRERDALQLELSKLVEALRDEPPDSERRAELRGKLALAHKRMAELSAEFEKQNALVQAWVRRQSGEGGA